MITAAVQNLSTLNLVFGILIIVFAVFIIIAVLMQSSKNRSLSGVVSGGAETFFGKKKASSIERTLNVLTIIASVIFAILVLLVCILNQLPEEKAPATDGTQTEQTEDKTEDKTEDTTEDKTEDKTEDTTEDKTEDKTEDTTEDTTEDKTEDTGDDTAEEGTESTESTDAE